MRNSRISIYYCIQEGGGGVCGCGCPPPPTVLASCRSPLDDLRPREDLLYRTTYSSSMYVVCTVVCSPTPPTPPPTHCPPSNSPGQTTSACVKSWKLEAGSQRQKPKLEGSVPRLPAAATFLPASSGTVQYNSTYSHHVCVQDPEAGWLALRRKYSPVLYCMYDVLPPSCKSRTPHPFCICVFSTDVEKLPASQHPSIGWFSSWTLTPPLGICVPAVGAWADSVLYKVKSCTSLPQCRTPSRKLARRYRHSRH